VREARKSAYLAQTVSVKPSCWLPFLFTLQELHRQEAAEKANAEADAAAAEAAVALAGPADDEIAKVPLHLMTGKERKKHVKKVQKQRTADDLPVLDESEIESLFAFPTDSASTPAP
jgi:hypothetical protein